VRFEIILAPGAAEQLRSLPAHDRSKVRDALEVHLRYEPSKVSRSRSRIKRLRGFERPQYRLRVNEIRVFYDVTETDVDVLAIVPKAQAQAWLDEEGAPAQEGGAGEDEG
jgi:mRNA-degrading endonuclease RelE of RelBE toxin-antitoxin system